MSKLLKNHSFFYNRFTSLFCNNHVWEWQKNNKEAYDPSKLSKTTQNQKYQYFLISTPNQPPKTMFQDPPHYLPKCFPKFQGPHKTPQTSRGPLKSMFSDLIFNNDFRTLTCSRANFWHWIRNNWLSHRHVLLVASKWSLSPRTLKQGAAVSRRRRLQ